MGIVVATPYICASYMQSYAAAQLAQAPDDDVEFYLRRQLQVSSHPEEDLVAALSSQRAPLALAATNVLEQKRRHWRELAAIRYRDEAIQIAVQLSDRWERLTPTARQAAVGLAEEVVTWNLGLEPDEARQFNDAIDQILRRSAAAEPSVTERPLVSALAMLPAQAEPARPSEYPSPERIADAPGGYLPISTGKTGTKVDQTLRTPGGFPTAAALTSKPIDPRGSGDREPIGSAGSMGLSPGALPESARPSLPMDLKSLADIDVMHWLNDTRPEIVEQAEEELRSRRFQPFELELARRLTSPSVQDRLRLAKELSVETTFDRRMWLVELSHDVDPDVRIAAQRQLLQLRVSDRGGPEDAPR